MAKSSRSKKSGNTSRVPAPRMVATTAPNKSGKPQMNTGGGFKGKKALAGNAC